MDQELNDLQKDAIKYIVKVRNDFDEMTWRELKIMQSILSFIQNWRPR